MLAFVLAWCLLGAGAGLVRCLGTCPGASWSWSCACLGARLGAHLGADLGDLGSDLGAAGEIKSYHICSQQGVSVRDIAWYNGVQ